MSNVETDEKARKEDLLKARREKLLKWKNQKAKQDAVKAAAASKEGTLTQEKALGDDVLSNRRDKLAAWKQKKRVQAETAATVEPAMVKKAKKNKKKRFTFGGATNTTQYISVQHSCGPFCDPITYLSRKTPVYQRFQPYIWSRGELNPCPTIS